MLKIVKLIFPLIIFSSCAIEQDYFFEKNGEVKMNVGVDMSSLFQSLPSDKENGLGNIKDSISANTDIQDSLEQYGITKFEIDFDTNKYLLTSNMVFKNLDYFQKFMNKDREEGLKPIEVKFSSSNFSVKNCASLIPDEMLKGLNNSDKENEDMDMSKFFTFKTTYHFPYEVDSFKSQSGKGLLSEDKKSISFENSIDEFTDSNFNGDLEVKF